MSDCYGIELGSNFPTVSTVLFMAYVIPNCVLMKHKLAKEAVLPFVFQHYMTAWLSLTDVPDGVVMYKSLYLFGGILDEVYRPIFATYTFLSVSVGSITFAIAFKYGVSLWSFIAFGVGMIFVICLNILAAGLAIMFTKSGEFIYRLSMHRRGALARKYVASLRQCRFHCGSQFFVDSRALMTINQAIVDNGITILLLFK